MSGAGLEVSTRRSPWLGVIAAVGALCTVLLGLSTNVASSLVPAQWTDRHAGWVWGVMGVLALASSLLAVLAARGGARNTTAGPKIDVRDSSGAVVVVGDMNLQSVESDSGSPWRTGQVVVGELPGAPPALVSRSAIAEIEELFAGGRRVVAVSAVVGGRGTGKTQVAAAYARQAVEDGVTLVAWVSAESRDRLLPGLAEVARRLEITAPSDDAAACAAKLRDALAARTELAVLVLDNASEPAVLRRYLPATGAVRVIITSTDRAFTSLGATVDVGGFARSQSLAYLARRTGRNDDIGAGLVADELEDLPLALAQAATVINVQGLTYENYLHRLATVSLDDALPADRGDAYPHGVAEAILLSVGAVGDEDKSGLTARVLNVLAFLAAEGVDRNILAQWIDEDVDGAISFDETLGHLVEASLIVWANDRRSVAMHRLTARAIRDRLERVGDFSSTVSAIAVAVRHALPNVETWWDGREWDLASSEIASHSVNIWNIVVDAVDRGVPEPEEFLVPVARLAGSAIHQLGRGVSDPDLALELAESVAELCERVLGPDNPETLAALQNLASACRAAGDIARAARLSEETLAARERVLGPDHPDTLSSRHDLGVQYQAIDTVRMVQLCEQAMEGRERVLGKDHPDTMMSCHNLAVAYESAGDVARAIPFHKQALATSERVFGEDYPETQRFRSQLAHAYREVGEFARAIPLYEQVVAGGDDLFITVGVNIELCRSYLDACRAELRG